MILKKVFKLQNLKIIFKMKSKEQDFKGEGMWEGLRLDSKLG